MIVKFFSVFTQKYNVKSELPYPFCENWTNSKCGLNIKGKFKCVLNFCTERHWYISKIFETQLNVEKQLLYIVWKLKRLLRSVRIGAEKAVKTWWKSTENNYFLDFLNIYPKVWMCRELQKSTENWKSETI